MNQRFNKMCEVTWSHLIKQALTWNGFSFLLIKPQPDLRLGDTSLQSQVSRVPSRTVCLSTHGAPYQFRSLKLNEPDRLRVEENVFLHVRVQFSKI